MPREAIEMREFHARMLGYESFNALLETFEPEPKLEFCVCGRMIVRHHGACIDCGRPYDHE